MKRIFLGILIFPLLCLPACGQKPDEAAAADSFIQISQEQAKEMMAQDDGHVVVDVRRQDEYEEGHIPGAILIPNESITTEMPEELPDRNQIILIYCRSGNRSKEAAKKLFDMGYTNVYEFGGILDWTGEIETGLPDAAAGPETAVLTFSSFGGGGPEYSVVIDDPQIVRFSTFYDYGTQSDKASSGDSYHVVFTFFGLKSGTTTVTVFGRSPILNNMDSVYTVTVDEKLNVQMEAVRRISTFYLSRSSSNVDDFYNITLEPDGYYVSVDEEPEIPVRPELIDALLNIIESYNLQDWDGFNEDGGFAPDSEDYWLEIRFTDDTRVVAKGDNAYPENYFEAMGEIHELLEQMAKTTP